MQPYSIAYALSGRPRYRRHVLTADRSCRRATVSSLCFLEFMNHDVLQWDLFIGLGLESACPSRTLFILGSILSDACDDTDGIDV